MIQFVKATFNFNPCYEYKSEHVVVRWNIEGLLIYKADKECYLDGEPCSAGQLIPWSVLLPKRTVLLKSEGVEIPISFSCPRDEDGWIRYLKKDFPLEERINAINMYFGVNYINKLLLGKLYPSFFTSCLKAFAELGVGPNNHRMNEVIRRWKDRYLSYLASTISQGNEQHILASVSEIKNQVMT